MFQNLLNQIKTLLGGQNPNSPSVQAQQQFAPPQQIQVQNNTPNPILGAAAGAQNYLEQNATNPIPQFQTSLKDPLLLQVAKGIGNIVPGTLNAIFGKGMLAPGIDAVHEIQQGGNVPYSQLVSPQVKFGENIAAGATPQEMLGNAAGSVEPIASAATVATQPQAAVQNFKDPAINLFTKIMQGVATGGKFGALFGGLSGLQQGQKAQTFKDDLLNTLAQTAVGAGTGAVLGGTTAGVGGVIHDLTGNPGNAAENPENPDQGLVAIMQKVKAGQELTPEEKQTFQSTPLAKWQELDTGVPQALEKQRTQAAIDQAEAKYAPGQIPNNTSVLMREVNKTGMVPMEPLNEEMPLGKGFEQEMDDLSNKTPEQLAAMNGTPDQKAGVLNPENAETNQQLNSQTVEQPPNPGQPAGNPADVAKQARMAHFAANQNINFRAGTLAQQMNQILTTPEDNLNFRLALEEPNKLNDYANQSANPDAFKTLAKQYSDFTDYVFSQAKDNKVDLNNVQDYFTHIWDLSTPEAQQTYQDLMANVKNYQSGFTKERFINTIKQGLAAGLTLKNDNASDDVLQYAQSMGKQISAAAFNNKINDLRPNGAVPLSNGGAYNYQGIPFEQSNVPGNKGTLIDPELQKNMQYYNQNPLLDNPWIKAYDTINRTMKEVKLGGGLFHALRETLNYAGSTAATGNAPDLPTGARVFLDPSFATNTFQKYIDDGTLDSLSQNGVQLSNASGIGDETSNPLTLLTSKDPIKKATFQRLINYYILDTWDKLPEDQKTPEMGAQVQAMYSGVNQEVAGNSKVLGMVLRNIFLAPQFNIGKLVNIKSALTPSLAPQNNFARAAIGSTVLATAVEYELANFVLNHKVDTNLASVVMNGVLHPAVSLPYQSPSGKGLQADLPSSDVGDLWKTLTNPAHALTSRTAALPSTINQLISGKDYYGNPVTPGGVLESQLPIPGVQILRTLQENPKTEAKDAQGHPIPGTGQPYQDWRTAALNTAGLRVHNDPNDPTVQAQNQYFQGIAQTAQGLNQNEKQIFMGVIHPTKQDAQGNLIVDPNTNLTPEKYQAFLDHPNILAAEQQFQQQQQSHSPLWNMPLDAIKAYMAYDLETDPGQKAQIRLQNPWIPQLQTALASYGASIAQATGGTPSITSPSPLQKLTPQMVQVVSAYTALPAGSPQRKQLLAQNPWLKDYWNANSAYYAQNPQQNTAPQSGLNQYLQGAGIAPITTAQTGYSSYSSGGGRGYRPSHAMPRGLNPYSGLKGLNRYATMKIARAKTAAEPKPKGIRVTATKIGIPAKQKQIGIKLAKAPKQSAVHIKQFKPMVLHLAQPRHLAARI